MMELLVLGCTGVVVFLHGAHFFFHVLTQHIALRIWHLRLAPSPALLNTSASGSEVSEDSKCF